MGKKGKVFRLFKTRYLLFFILLLTAFLRFWRLGEVPLGFHRDEAFLGYNAYSILKTGRDINGIFLPLHLKSFLYSPALYSYFSIPFIFLFGLNPFSVRFASTLFGVLTVFLTYFLVQELFFAGFIEKRKGLPKESRFIALLASFLLAISPWHINLSRTATENVIAIFFIALSVFLLLRWARTQKAAFLIFSFASFSFTFLIYQAPRAFLPLFIPFMIMVLEYKRLDRKKILLSLALYLITIIIPLVFILFSPNLSLRIRTVSIFATQETQLNINQFIREDGVSALDPLISRLFHNKIIGYSSQFLQNYAKHFSFDFLFGDNGFPERYRVPSIGLLYLFELPFLLFGIWKIFYEQKRLGIILIGWILLAPLGSALTFDDVPNLQRTLIVFPALSIVCAYGIERFFSLVQNKIKGFVLIILIPFAFYNIAFYLHQYYFHVNKYRPWYRNDGYKELVQKVNLLLPSYKKAVITNRESAPAIFFLFFGRYDPLTFQKETRYANVQDFDRVNFGRYVFSTEECPLKAVVEKGKIVPTGEKDVLYVNSSLCKNIKGARIIDRIKRADNSQAFTILDMQ